MGHKSFMLVYKSTGNIKEFSISPGFKTVNLELDSKYSYLISWNFSYIVINDYQ